MTKNLIKAKIKLALSLIKAANDVILRLVEDLKGVQSTDAAISVWKNAMFGGEYVNEKVALKALDNAGFLDGMEEGEEISLPTVKVYYGIYPQISVPVSGGYFETFASESDFGTWQAGLLYKCKDSIFDLALAEVKRGELAEAVDLKSDNQDVEFYVFSDISNEDYTEKYRFGYQNFCEIADAER